MTTQQMLAPFRKAVTDFDMIADGDRVAVGLSGGKDSLTLLTLLSAYQKFSPEKFELAAVRVDMGFKDSDPEAAERLRSYSESLGVPYTVVKTDIAEIVFEARKEKNPCSLCSKMRRGCLNTELNSRGFNKLALGHHADDLAETLLLSVFYEGRLSTFTPTAFMSRTEVTLIRPMISIEEKDIRAYSKDMPVLHNPCPANCLTKREYMKDLIRHIQKEIPFAKDRLISAITHPERNNLW
jgi:tRNA(Ile)-lysidine synthase TilS/MesJ